MAKINQLIFSEGNINGYAQFGNLASLRVACNSKCTFVASP